MENKLHILYPSKRNNGFYFVDNNQKIYNYLPTAPRQCIYSKIYQEDFRKNKPDYHTDSRYNYFRYSRFQPLAYYRNIKSMWKRTRMSPIDDVNLKQRKFYTRIYDKHKHRPIYAIN